MKEIVNIRLEPETITSVKAVAKKEVRSVSQMIDLLLQHALKTYKK